MDPRSRYLRGFLKAAASPAGAGPSGSTKDPALARASAIFEDWMTHRRVQVRRGETLAGIARRNGVGLETLMEENNIPSVTAIRPGQTLKIPNGLGKGKGKETANAGHVC